jgi:hypothetical protein
MTLVCMKPELGLEGIVLDEVNQIALKFFCANDARAVAGNLAMIIPHLAETSSVDLPSLYSQCCRTARGHDMSEETDVIRFASQTSLKLMGIVNSWYGRE